MLAFIDQVVIPFLDSLYGAVGYVGVLIAMAIESAMIPLPSELILPYAGFLVSDLAQLEPISNGSWSFWIVVVVATIGNTLGSLVGYAIGSWGGRPFLERRHGSCCADGFGKTKLKIVDPLHGTVGRLKTLKCKIERLAVMMRQEKITYRPGVMAGFQQIAHRIEIAL